MKIIGYIRVSTEEQATHGHSLGSQEAKLQAYCDLYSHDLLEVIVDAGQSAKTLHRPGLQRALNAMAVGAAEGLLVVKLDRLTRSVRDLGELLEGPFRRSALISVAEQFDTTSAAGRLVLNLMASVSQWEREVISERTSTALQHKKSQGVRLGPPAMECPQTVGRVRQLRNEGLTLKGVAARLAAEGYATKRGGRWQPQTIKLILDRVGASNA